MGADWVVVWGSGWLGTECLPKFLYEQNFLLVYVNFAMCNLACLQEQQGTN